jgi:tetratricopeptide (TPR) repeat protein
MTVPSLELTVNKNALLIQLLLLGGLATIAPPRCFADTARVASAQVAPSVPLQAPLQIALPQIAPTHTALLLAQAAQPDDDRLNDLIRQGRELVDAGKVPEAIAIYQQASALAPDNARVFSAIGFLQAKQRDYQAAVEAYEQAIKLDARNADFYYALGYSKANLNDNAGAAEAYRQATQLKPDYVEAFLGLGIVLSRQEDYAGAIAAYQQVLTRRPNDARIYESIGTAYIQQERYPEALEALQHAIQLSPRQGSAFLNLGVAFLNSGNVPEGMAALQRAAALEPRNGLIFLQLGDIYKAQGNQDDALIQYRRAVSVQPSLKEAYMALGKLYLEQKDVLAIVAFRELVELAPQDPDAHYYLGVALQERDRNDEATTMFQQARDLYTQSNNEEGIKKANDALVELQRINRP